MIISIDNQKDLMQYNAFVIKKKFRKLSIEVSLCNWKKNIHKIATANIFDGKRSDDFPLWSETRQRYLSPLLIKIILEALSRATKQEKSIGVKWRRHVSILLAGEIIIQKILDKQQNKTPAINKRL